MMITDPGQFVELLRLIKTNPEAAAKALAASGMRPDELMNIGQMGLGEMAAPASEIPLSAGAPRQMGTFAGGAGPPQMPPSNQFTMPGAGEVPMAQPAVTQDMTKEPTDMGYSWNMPLPIEQNPQVGAWQTSVQPEAAAGGPDLGKLMAGLKGLSPQSADTKPIFGANAPLGRDMQQVKPSQPINMQMVMQMLQSGRSSQPSVPTLGALMGRG